MLASTDLALRKFPVQETNQGIPQSVLPKYYPALAVYLSKYIQAYKAAGLHIWAITPQNEPLTGNYPAPRESAVWGMGQEDQFVQQYLGPELMVDNISDTKIFIFDHDKGDPSSDSPPMLTWAQSIYGDSKTLPFLAGMAVHWYASSYLVYQNGLDALHAINPNMGIWFNEGTADSFINGSPYPVPASKIQAAAWWQNDDRFWTKSQADWGYNWGVPADHPIYEPVYRYARDLIVGLNHWYIGWLDWVAVLSKYGAMSESVGGAGNVGDPGVSHIANGLPAGIMVDLTTPSSPVLYYTPIFLALPQV